MTTTNCKWHRSKCMHELMTSPTICRGLIYPLGALLFTNETYRETLPLIASGLPSAPAVNPGSNTWLYDYEHGSQHSISSISYMTSDPVFQTEIDKYTQIWNSEFAPFVILSWPYIYSTCRIIEINVQIKDFMLCHEAELNIAGYRYTTLYL